LGCCSLKEKNKKFSRIEFFIRFNFFRLLHNFFLIVVLIKSKFNKKYKNIYLFHKKFYKKAAKELQ